MVLTDRFTASYLINRNYQKSKLRTIYNKVFKTFLHNSLLSWSLPDILLPIVGSIRSQLMVEILVKTLFLFHHCVYSRYVCFLCFMFSRYVCFLLLDMYVFVFCV